MADKDIMDLDLDLGQFADQDNTDNADTNTGLPLAFQSNVESIIKVVGVGGGGGNAVNHMYNTGIHDVTFAVCNTDKKALNDSPVPYKLQLGEGLGAGNRPEKARKAAEESIPQDRKSTRLNSSHNVASRMPSSA